MPKSIAVNDYLICALWSSTGDDDAPLDDTYSTDDIAPESVERATKDLGEFTKRAGSLLDDIDPEQVAHDLWLTRNHHGAGFWDRGYPKAMGDKLTELAQDMGECYAYVGDDGKVYIE